MACALDSLDAAGEQIEALVAENENLTSRVEVMIRAEKETLRKRL